MNNEKLSSAASQIAFLEQVRDPASQLSAKYASDKAVLKAALGALQTEGVLADYADLFTEAETISRDFEPAMAELQGENVARSFTQFHKNTLEMAAKDAKRYHEICEQLVAILDTHGYEVAINGEVSAPAQTEAPSDEAAELELASASTPEVTEVAAEEPVPEQLETPEAEAVVQKTPEKNQSKLELLTELYKNADSSVFRNDSKENPYGFKTYATIREEIKTVLETAGFDSGRVRIFLNEVVNRIGHEVKGLARKQSEENDINKRNELKSAVSQKYQDLLSAVAGFLQTEKVDEAHGELSPELPVEGIGNIDEAKAAAIAEFELYQAAGGYEANKDFMQAASIVERLRSYSESDPVRAANDTERYVRKLQKALAKLRLETGEVVLETNDSAGEVDDPLKITDSSGSATEAVTTPDADAPEAAAPDVDTAAAGSVTDSVDEVEVPRSTDKNIIGLANEIGEKKYENNYEASKAVLFNLKKDYREKQETYNTALSEYYEQQKSNNSLRARVGATLRKMTGLGVSPELPEALKQMQSDYDETRLLYAKSLDLALMERSKRTTKGAHKNYEYSLQSDETKVAFSRKFILKPKQEMAAMQEESVLSPETKARLSSVMATMAKHKWATRIGIVTAAGIAGALSGGVGLALAGASYQVSKMAVSAGAGAAAGFGANRLTQRGVNKAEAAFTDKSKQFTLDDFTAFEEELLGAQADVASAKTKQKVATIGAAVLAGGATGYGLSGVDMDRFIPGQSNTLSDEAVQRIVAAEAEAARPAPVFIDPQPATPEPTPAPETVVAPEMIDGIKIERFTIPFYGNSGERLFETVISDIKIEGSFDAEKFTPQTKLELEKFIKLSMDDALHAHPYVAETKLEAEVLSKVQAKFGSAPWYPEGGITKIDIRGMSLEEYFIKPPTPPVEVIETQEGRANIIETRMGDQGSVYAEAAPVTERVVGEANRVTINVDGADRTYTEARPSVTVAETQTQAVNRIAINAEGTERTYTEARPAVTQAAASEANRVVVNLDNTERVYTEARPAAPAASEVVSTSTERVRGNYVVQKGETLSEITEKKFAGLLKDIPENKRGVLMDELFRNVQTDETLRNSLGMRSGDVDLIYPNEKLNLDGVEAELSRLVEREKTLDLFRTSGPLTVEADAEVKSVPITVVEKPESVTALTPITTAEATAAATTAASANFLANRAARQSAGEQPALKKEVIPPPRTFALDGQFAATPAYKDYLRKTIGTEKAQEQVIERAVTNLDKTTYDLFSIFGDSYESPYTFLGDMTLKEVALFEGKPNKEVRDFLKEKGVKYETYLAWLDKIDEMVAMLPNQNETKVSDLFTRYVAETQIQKGNSLIT